MLSTLVQGAIEQEFESFMGARPYERSPERAGWRNGYKDRTLKTRVGALMLRIPKDRDGRFHPSLFERYERSEKALVLALIEMYVQGVSTRKVTKIVEELCGHMISASAVSLLTKKLDGELATWRQRDLSGKTYPYLVVDAHYEQVRREAHVRSTAVLWVIGISVDGYREHLGVWTGNSESLESWGEVFSDLVQRGLAGVRYAVSDEHLGLVKAMKRYFPGAVFQRCQVHYLRNALSSVSSLERKRAVAAAIRDAWSAPTAEEARARARRFAATVRKAVPRLAEWIEESFEDTLGFYTLGASEHRRRLKTTNSMEHDHAEVRRRSRVVRIFPNEASVLRLLSALAVERNEQWMERRYLTMTEEENNRKETEHMTEKTRLRQSA
ncbi:MAG: IS256 family transposase [Gemmatimonadota bacterium]|nr:IS256 family transposase [Gemmatimonadota bacterium]